MQKMYVLIMSTVFQLLGKLIKTQDDMVLFVSFMGKNYNDSPKVLYEHIRNNKKYKQYKCIWAFEHPEKFQDLNTVKIDTMSYFLTALRAKYWITNTNIERGLKFKKEDQIYLNTWHGIALKYIGNDCPGRKDYNFDTLDYLTVSSEYEERVFKRAFRAKEKSYLRCGMPRNQELWNADEITKQSLRTKLGIPDNKKVILYAPTWRESLDGGKSYQIKPPIHFKKWKEIIGDEYVVYFRAHHLTTKVMGVKYDDFVINASDYPNVNDLLIVADLLITDYSAIAFDYSILCKPILCYAYDYETYLAERGTYFDIDEYYPNKSCRTEKELLQRILNLDYKKESENTKKFRDRFIQYGENATEICVKKVLG